MDRNMLLQNKLTHSHKTSRKFRAEQYCTGPPEGWAAVGFCRPSLFQQGVVGAFAEGFGVGKSQDLGLQPIMPLDLLAKVRSWELTVYPRSHIRRWFGVTRPAQARM